MKTLILFLDAINPNYITPRTTPFLYFLCQKFKGPGVLKPVFGYESIVGSFLTGVYPEKHGLFAIYGWQRKVELEKIAFLLKITPSPFRPAIFFLYQYFSGADYYNSLIDHQYLKYFSFSHKHHFHHRGILDSKTIFDILEQEKIPFLSYKWPFLCKNYGYSKLIPFIRNNDRERTKTFLNLLKNTKQQVYFLQLWDIDKYGHTFGPDLKKLTPHLRILDNCVKEIVSHFSLEDDNILVWSDHGMVKVEQQLDLLSLLPKNGDGYFFFLDSTMTRFWFLKKKRKKQVMAILKKIDGGHVLTSTEKKQFHIQFKNDFNGEEIFLLNPGVIFLPNFFQGGQKVDGMHGYDLSRKEEYGFFLINEPFVKKGRTIDIFPTICQMLKIPINFKIDGHSLLTRIS